MSGSEREVQILSEARALVALEGVDSLTMRRLGRRSQIAAAGIYHYFRSRDDLVDHLHTEVFADFRATLGPPPTDTGTEAVGAWLAGGRSWLAEHGELVALTAECAARRPMAGLPEDFLEIVAGQADLTLSPAVAAIKPCMLGTGFLLVLRSAGLPEGAADLTGVLGSFRSFVGSVTGTSSTPTAPA